MAEYVLDSYAVLALLSDDAGAEEFGAMLEDTRNHFWMSVVNLGEVYYVVARKEGEVVATQTMSDIRGQENVTIVDATWDRVLQAAKFKMLGSLSYADAFACGLAVECDAIVISGDPEFRNVPGIRVVWPAS